LQELVYKQGQAGVTKATVTIVFNNSDTSSSPVGYESHKQITVTRQVVIGGKNKYMINGHTVQQSQVQNLFHSVQLNVNNPHFLIMQGRITKVLNMKPIETLSMIEEAAGTRMFETKKQAAIKTIEKKQLKVEELSKCMDEEITPTLENLRGERQYYITWQSNNMELERLERFCVASEYREAELKVSKSEEDKEVILAELDGLQTLQDSMQKEADECARKSAEIEKQRESEAEGGFQDLKKSEADLSKELVKSNALLSNHMETIATEKEAAAALVRQTESSATQAVEKNAELARCAKELVALEAEALAAETEATTIRERYQNACAGVADETSAALLSLPEQVGAWEKRAREAESQQQQGSLRSSHAREQLKELRKSAKQMQASHGNGLKEAEALQKKVTALEERLAGLGVSPSQEGDLRARIAQLQASSASLQDEVQKLNIQLNTRLAFDYKDPEKSFDRSRVKGVVASLVRVNDNRTSNALEVAAGAKLFHVVVDTATTGQLLLDKGQLKKRVTIMPLNKISNRCTEASKVAAAKSIASARGGSANLALELVSFDEEVRRAMEHVFGNVLICSSSDIAKAVAFDRSVKTKCITLDGDVFDPSGTLVGGSATTNPLLNKIEELMVAKESLGSQMQELNALKTQLARLNADSAAVNEVTQELELKRYALKMCQDKMADSSYAQVMAEIETLAALVVTCEEEAVTLKAAYEKAKEKLKTLKTAESGIKKQRDAAMKEMEASMKAAQKASAAIKSRLQVLRNKRDALMAELDGMTKDSGSLQEQRKICEATLARMQAEAETLTSKLAQKREAYEIAKTLVAEKQAELNACSKEIKALEVAKATALKAKTEASLEARKLTHKLKAWEKECKDAAAAVKSLLKQHPWIEKDKAFFGTAGSDFDFAAKDVPASRKRLSDIKKEQEKLSKKINKKVMGMIEKAESEYTELARKKEVILNDKAKIETVIAELDVKKAQALQTTWIKVNRDFGSIFSMLLPGTHAKLEPQEGMTVAEGLEVKVAFNGVWKESLTELSGGQRSLLALSLILALLLFKPAPMYILDEVDAALDLSHTQNIGMMLRTHFSASQFIVVSLKEGMFNNANVIFRTRFVDGISAVSRTVGRGKANTPLSISNGTEEGEEDAPLKKKGKATGKGGKGKAVLADGSENQMIEA